MDGLSILKRWRPPAWKPRFLVLTARGSWMERVDGFEAGADDYLPKPFRTEELLARLKPCCAAAASTSPPSARPAVSSSTRQAGASARRPRHRGQPARVPLITYLADRKGQVVAPLYLANHVQGRDTTRPRTPSRRWSGRLRKKTDSAAIETRRGFG